MNKLQYSIFLKLQYPKPVHVFLTFDFHFYPYVKVILSLSDISRTIANVCFKIDLQVKNKLKKKKCLLLNFKDPHTFCVTKINT